MPLTEFFSQFNAIVRMNGWIENNSIGFLLEREGALDFGMHRWYREFRITLKSKLKLRFRECDSSQNFYSQFTNRK